MAFARAGSRLYASLQVPALAYVVDDVCVVRFDNERGRGDHWHYGADTQPFVFQGLEQLLVDFEEAIMRWNNEHGLD